MKTASYPAIGQRVTFVRQGQNGEVVEGSGLIEGIILDPSKRLMVHLETTEKNGDGASIRRNVHVTCLNPSDDFKAQFKAAQELVQSLGDEGNGKVKEIVAGYNQRVDEAQEPVLGGVVLFDE